MNSSHITPIYPAYAGRHQFQNCDTLLSTEDLFRDNTFNVSGNSLYSNSLRLRNRPYFEDSRKYEKGASRFKRHPYNKNSRKCGKRTSRFKNRPFFEDSRKLESIASPYSELVTCKEPDSRKTFTITQDNVIDLFLRECDLYLSVLNNVKLTDETLPNSRRVPDKRSQSMFVKIYNEIVRYLRLFEESFIANEEFQSNFESLPVSDRSFSSRCSSSEMYELPPLGVQNYYAEKSELERKVHPFSELVTCGDKDLEAADATQDFECANQSHKKRKYRKLRFIFHLIQMLTQGVVGMMFLYLIVYLVIRYVMRNYYSH
ncbi:hypothetical protein CDAR_568371 [Caerostris darwini]|uniref:Uncharacterized protein n=1 Tax=Caerostris darwini TaxID=1538125 RepID=A0AAV4PII5_9ARAC|nr:hypothetical protein CDAR_568371 [Caerostris darwini]